MDDKPGFLQTMGAVALALFVFVIISALLSMIVTVPLKLLRGCTLSQAFQPEPEGIFFGIAILCLLGVYLEIVNHYGPDRSSVATMATFALFAVLKSLHSLVVIWNNPNLGTVEIGRIIRH